MTWVTWSGQSKITQQTTAAYARELSQTAQLVKITATSLMVGTFAEVTMVTNHMVAA